MKPVYSKWQPHGLRFLLIFCIAIFLPAFSANAKKKAPDHPIDLNVPNEKELEELPGVGPTTAKSIVDFREKSGRFKRVEDLLVIRGISEAKLEKMRPYLTVGPPPTPKSPPVQSSPKPAPPPKPAQ
jgi:competence ComEA-like helix-hairpin-helix protein